MNKGSKIIIVLLIFIIIGIAVVLILNDRGIIHLCGPCKCLAHCAECKETKIESSKENSDVIIEGEISDADKDVITKMIGLKSDGYEKINSETKKALDLTNGDYVDINQFTMKSIFMYLDNGEYTFEDLDYADKKRLLLVATYIYNLKLDEVKLYGDDVATKIGIKKDVYDKLAKMYNANPNPKAYLETTSSYDGYVLYDVTGAISAFVGIEDSVNYSKTNTGAIIDYSAKLFDLDNKEISNKDYKYVFRNYPDGSYYLYKVIVTKK